MDGRDRCRGDLFVAGGRDEFGAGTAQRALAGDDARLLPHEAGHAGDDEEEEQGGADDQHEDVRVVNRLGETDARRDQARTAQQHQSQRRQTRSRSSAGSSSDRIDGWSAAAPQSR